jgi:hypothetical protein
MIIFVRFTCRIHAAKAGILRSYEELELKNHQTKINYYKHVNYISEETTYEKYNLKRVEQKRKYTLSPFLTISEVTKAAELISEIVKLKEKVSRLEMKLAACNSGSKKAAAVETLNSPRTSIVSNKIDSNTRLNILTNQPFNEEILNYGIRIYSI